MVIDYFAKYFKKVKSVMEWKYATRDALRAHEFVIKPTLHLLNQLTQAENVGQQQQTQQMGQRRPPQQQQRAQMGQYPQQGYYPPQPGYGMPSQQGAYPQQGYMPQNPVNSRQPMVTGNYAPQMQQNTYPQGRPPISHVSERQNNRVPAAKHLSLSEMWDRVKDSQN